MFDVSDMNNEDVSEEVFQSADLWNKMREKLSSLCFCNFVHCLFQNNKACIRILGEIPDGIVKGVAGSATKICIAFSQPPLPSVKVKKLVVLSSCHRKLHTHWHCLT